VRERGVSLDPARRSLKGAKKRPPRNTGASVSAGMGAGVMCGGGVFFKAIKRRARVVGFGTTDLYARIRIHVRT